jgi:hypothetical protein
LVHALARLSGAEADGFSGPEVKASLYASLLFSLGALLFAYRLIRRRLGGRYRAALVPLLVACGGPVVYYAIRQPGYAHPFATFWTAWLIDAWDASYGGRDAARNDRREPRPLATWLGFGALLGLAALARPQLVLWGVIFLAAAVDDVLRQMPPGSRTASSWRALGLALRLSGPRWAAGATLSLLLFAPQLLAWKALYGGYVVVPQGPDFMRWDAPAWSEVLFASRNGLFPWAPLYALGALGLLVALVRAPRLALALIAGILLQTVANGAVWDWWAGGSFGGRRFDSCFIALAFGLAALVIGNVERPERRGWGLWWPRIATAAVLLPAALLAAGNIGLASSYSAPSVRIRGGQAAWQVMKQRIRGPLGPVVAAASRAANAPARAIFALRYGRPFSAYDQIVGVHSLGELYPGLNSFQGKTRDAIRLNAGSARIQGAAPGTRPGSIKLTGNRASILIGLNRFGPVTFAIKTLAPPSGGQNGGAQDGGTLAVHWNGRELSRQPATGNVRIRVTANQVIRGVNVLAIEAPVGAEIIDLVLTGPGDPRGE